MVSRIKSAVHRSLLNRFNTIVILLDDSLIFFYLVLELFDFSLSTEGRASRAPVLAVRLVQDFSRPPVVLLVGFEECSTLINGITANEDGPPLVRIGDVLESFRRRSVWAVFTFFHIFLGSGGFCARKLLSAPSGSASAPAASLLCHILIGNQIQYTLFYLI